MLRRYPGTVRLRQALPPLFVLSLIVLLFTSLFLPLARFLLVVEVIVYLFTLIAVGIQTSLKQKEWTLIFGIPLAISIMHVSWGTGFIWSMIGGIFTKTALEKN